MAWAQVQYEIALRWRCPDCRRLNYVRDDRPLQGEDLAECLKQLTEIDPKTEVPVGPPSEVVCSKCLKKWRAGMSDNAMERLGFEVDGDEIGESSL